MTTHPKKGYQYNYVYANYVMGCGSSSSSSIIKLQRSGSALSLASVTEKRNKRRAIEVSGIRESANNILPNTVQGTDLKDVSQVVNKDQNGERVPIMFQAVPECKKVEEEEEEEEEDLQATDTVHKVTADTEPETGPKTTHEANAKGHKLTVEEIEAWMLKYISLLQNTTDYNSGETTEALEFIAKKLTLKIVTENPKVCSSALKAGLVETSIEIWKNGYKKDFHTAENKHIWQRMKSCLIILWNGTDRYLEMCERILYLKIHVYFLEVLNDANLCELSDSNTAQIYVLKGSLGILHNTLVKCEAAREQYREVGAVATFQKLLDARYLMIKVKAIINLAYIINEDENEIINANEKNIGFITKILSSAMKAENHRSKRYGFTAVETVEALNMLAANDSNKDRILDSGVLDHYIVLLSEESTENEQLEAARGIWTLAFSDHCRQTINEHPTIKESLLRLANCGNSKIGKAANGALWTLKGEHKQPSKLESGLLEESENTGHIMISYNWGVKPLALRIRRQLVDSGYKVWMDVDNMTGSTLEAMADAVEKASVIIVCMTHKYKESPSCRTEAEYTYQLRKPFIPLRLEAAFKADGWLGIMIGTKLWFDFIKNFDSAYDGLVKELGNRGKQGPLGQSKVISPATSHMTLCAPPAQLSYTKWSEKDVSKWLNDNGLQQYARSLEGMDGSLLEALRTMRQESPEFFYTTLRDNMHLSLVSILKFTVALKSLK